MVTFHMNTRRPEPRRNRRSNSPDESLATGVDALRTKLDAMRKRIDRHELADRTAAQYLELRQQLGAADFALAEAARTLDKLLLD